MHHFSCISLCLILILRFGVDSFQVNIPRQYGSLHFHSRIHKFNKAKQNSSILGRKSACASLRMHMGHSHSHHHHSHDSRDISKSQSRPKPSTLRGKIFRQFSYPYRRLAACFLFATLAVGSPILLRQRRITTTDAAIFFFTAASLSISDKIRLEVRDLLQRVKRLRDGFIKNTSPLIHTTKFSFNLKNDAERVTFIGVIVNLVLSVGKAVIGIKCHSSALMADAGHSLSDLFSDFVALFAVKIGRLPPDDDHPYGHGKFEAMGSLFLALMLLATGFSIGHTSNAKLLKILSTQVSSGGAVRTAVKVPTVGALIMAGLSIISKEWLYRITRRVGDDLRSPVLIANAWHHRSDAYTSVLALGSIYLAMSVPGMLAADSAAGLLVAGFVCITGVEIMGDAVKQLTDTTDKDLVERVKLMMSEVSEDVLEVKRIRARWMGSSAIVDLAITTPDSLSASAIKAVEERVRFKIMDGEPSIFDLDVHAVSNTMINPSLTTKASDLVGKSVHEVEDVTRELLLGHSEVKSVQSCTVHYQDMLLPNVDAHIKLMSPEWTTIASAASVASELRELLEGSDSINRANIYLDLNENAYSLETVS